MTVRAPSTLGDSSDRCQLCGRAEVLTRHHLIPKTRHRNRRAYEFMLWLKDHLALYGVKKAVLAPGYRSPDQNNGEQ